MVARLPIIRVRIEHGPIAVQHFQTAHMPLGFLAFERDCLEELLDRQIATLEPIEQRGEMTDRIGGIVARS